MKYLICIFILLFLAFFFTMPKENKEIIEPVALEKEDIRVNYLLDDNKVILSLEDYVIGVVACEMPASFNNEALKAQAVAARTFALEKIDKSPNFVLDNGDQCYITIKEMQEKWNASYNLYYNKIKDAVYDTEGQYLSYNGKIIKSYYFSTSNGYTEDAENVFGNQLDYLVSVESIWDKDSSTYEKEIVYSKEEFLKMLSHDIKENIEIEINEKNSSGRINYLTINGSKYKGTTIRKLLNLRSTDFDIKEDKNNIIITTRGYGHGVGMSQYGANGMAEKKYKYDEILKYFYKNVEINNV